MTTSPSAIRIESGLDRNSLQSLRLAFQVFTTYPRAQLKADLIKLLSLPRVP